MKILLEQVAMSLQLLHHDAVDSLTLKAVVGRGWNKLAVGVKPITRCIGMVTARGKD